MKIAQISFCYQRTPPEKTGGIAWAASYLTEELVKMGHEVTLCATGDSVTKANLWSYFEEPPQFDGWGKEVIHVSKAYQYIRENDFDIIHNHNFALGLVNLYASDIPCVTSVHTSYHRTWSPLHKLLSDRLKFISLSRRQQELHPELVWIGSVHNGVAMEQFPFKAEREDYLLFIGRIHREKGVHLAIRAAKAAGRRLLLAGPLNDGGNDVSNDYFKEEVAPEIDGDKVVYLGEVGFEQKTNLYKNAAAVLVTSLMDEVSPMVVIEALACGAPVIALRKGAVHELVIHGETGFLATSLGELIEGIRNIDRLSPNNCRQYAELNLSVRTMAERYVQIYEQVLKER